MKQKIVRYMPDFDFQFLKIMNHFLSIPLLRIKRKYVIHLMEKLEHLYEEYVLSSGRYPSMGEKYLKTIFHDSHRIYPRNEGVAQYKIYDQLVSLITWLELWEEFQEKYELTDEELLQSAFIEEEDIKEALPSEKHPPL